MYSILTKGENIALRDFTELCRIMSLFKSLQRVLWVQRVLINWVKLGLKCVEKDWLENKIIIKLNYLLADEMVNEF